MNRPLAMAIALFLGATMLTITLPGQDAQAGWRRRCCGAHQRTRCHGRHWHRHRCHGSYGCYGGGYSSCHGGYGMSCHGGYAPDCGGMGAYMEGNPEDQYLAPPDEPMPPSAYDNSAPQTYQPSTTQPSVTEAPSSNTAPAEPASPSDTTTDAPPSPPDA